MESPRHGAGWPEVTDEADVIFVYEQEPPEPGSHFYFLLAYDADGEAHHNLGMAYWRQGRPKQAMREAEIAVQLGFEPARELLAELTRAVIA